MSDSGKYLAELRRLLDLLINWGVVEEVNPATGQCRVKIGELLTGWLYVQQPFGGQLGFSAPTKGEQVLVLLPDGGPGGVVLRNICSVSDLAGLGGPGLRVLRFADGQTLTYDESTSTLTASKPLHIVGDLKVTGSIECSGILQGGVMKSLGVMNVDGALNVKGMVNGAAEIMSAGIGLVTHVHPFSLTPPEVPPPKTETPISGVV